MYVTILYVIKILSSVCMDDGNVAKVDTFNIRHYSKRYLSAWKNV